MFVDGGPIYLEFQAADSPVSSLEAGDVNAQVLSFLHSDHLGGGFEAELLHHGLEVILAWTLGKRGGEESDEAISSFMYGSNRPQIRSSTNLSFKPLNHSQKVNCSVLPH